MESPDYSSGIVLNDISGQIKTRKDAIEDLYCFDDKERVLCDNIISHLEKDMAIGFRELKIIQVPRIGTMRINPFYKDFQKAKKSFKEIRKSITKEEYKDYVKTVYRNIIKDNKEKDIVLAKLNKIKTRNKNKYDELSINLGRKYATFYIKAIYFLKPIDFDEEFEDYYNNLK